tara:strand:- start:156 stop:605 length:450 start_codon:yes stop_codon:yes gene_type:complete
MKLKFIKYYLEIAKLTSQLSTAERLKVGAVIVKDDRIISIGYNGMPSGWSNVCEKPAVPPVTHARYIADQLVTKPEVLHAEANAITKLARSNESGFNSVMFCTHSPCLECSKLIYQSGISEVHYIWDYRSQNGTNFLAECDIGLTQHEV